jgi:hypothetical protein
VKVVKVNSDDADADSVTPLDFLLGVMRDADSQPTLRLRVARIVAPYVHRKGEPSPADEAPVAMVVLDDSYGFDGAPANLAETCLRVAVGEFRRYIETGVIDAGKIGVKRGSAKVLIVAQGPTT